MNSIIRKRPTLGIYNLGIGMIPIRNVPLMSVETDRLGGEVERDIHFLEQLWKPRHVLFEVGEKALRTSKEATDVVADPSKELSERLTNFDPQSFGYRVDFIIRR